MNIDIQKTNTKYYLLHITLLLPLLFFVISLTGCGAASNEDPITQIQEALTPSDSTTTQSEEASTQNTDSESSEDDASSADTATMVAAVNITDFIHESLPSTWISEFNTIKNNLLTLLPLYQTHYTDIDIYAWNDTVIDPYPGINGGAYISGKNNNNQHKIFVMEIPNNEFIYQSNHRFSVIAHEYFHCYQMTLNEHMNKYDDHPTSFKTKWLI